MSNSIEDVNREVKEGLLSILDSAIELRKEWNFKKQKLPENKYLAEVTIDIYEVLKYHAYYVTPQAGRIKIDSFVIHLKESIPELEDEKFNWVLSKHKYLESIKVNEEDIEIKLKCKFHEIERNILLESNYDIFS